MENKYYNIPKEIVSNMAKKKWLKTHGLNVAEGELQLSCLIAATTHDNSGVVLDKKIIRQRFQLEVFSLKTANRDIFSWF